MYPTKGETDDAISCLHRIVDINPDITNDVRMIYLFQPRTTTIKRWSDHKTYQMTLWQIKIERAIIENSEKNNVRPGKRDHMLNKKNSSWFVILRIYLLISSSHNISSSSHIHNFMNQNQLNASYLHYLF